MSDGNQPADLPLPENAIGDAFRAWWPRHAVRHNSRSPVAAREAFTAGWEAAAPLLRAQGAADDLNSEHGEAILEECARIVHGMFVAETRPPFGDCEQIARAVIEHAAPFLADDARDDGRAQGAAAERERELLLVWRDERGNEICRSTPLQPGATRIGIPLDAFCADLLAGDAP